MKFRIPIEPSQRNKFRLDITIASLLAVTFILIISRIAIKGTPSTRTNTWGIAVCIKSAFFLAYQLTTAHVERFKRWASTKANKILVIIDTLFWFALFIITILGTAGSHSTASRALGAIIVILVLVLLYVQLYG
ncbi:uncharacterized protein N7469_003029 [Penicillium citrinum]|uniref:Uncharacterized protein n=1 Tax=Penicillium citrinum TaxID=5077 RepID=A0A9W9PDS6_PENCI|nr:uncharacterized protein N7469_003029 [Penicillium citrinum]KAJ5241438.1 hypothetical protein N7469_003029 [Penicillium citrinum]